MTRQIVGACPGCGAEVSFHAGDTVLAVCEYCSTACVRSGEALRSVGKMAQLFDDHSPLRLGAHGAWEGRAFSLVGRLQYQYSQGTWNEWRILFDDGSPGWLSDDNGSYVVTLDKGVVAAPSFSEVTVGESLTFNGVSYTVAYREMATVVAGAGELPFIVGAGYEAPVVDLRGANGEIATLDYSDMITEVDALTKELAEDSGKASGDANDELGDKSVASEPTPLSAVDDMPAGPHLYLGLAAELSSLNMQGIAETTTRQVEIKPFSCPQCGATVTPQFTDSRSISCMSCASVMDLSQGVGSDIAFYRQSSPPKILLPIGSTGTFGGVAWTVVGFQRREGQADGEFFGWDEFLLHNREHGFRYLSCDTGHWSIGRVLQRSISTATDRYGRGVVRYKGKQFDQFSQYDCQTHYVMGEFFWRVNKNDKNFVIDYISPPMVLSRERAEKEINWSYSEYVPREAVAKAFGFKADDLPTISDVGMLAPLPSSRRSSFMKMALVSLVALVMTHLLLSLLGVNKELVKTRTLPLNGEVESHWVKLEGSRPSNVAIELISNINEASVAIAADLESRDTSQPIRELLHNLSYYSGYEGGESWSEGNQNPRIVFLAVPPGDYKVSLSARQDDGSAPTVSYDVSQRGKPNFWPLLAGLVVLLFLSGFGILGEPKPELLRWRNSQYGTRPGRPAAQMFDDDDDDD